MKSKTAKEILYEHCTKNDGALLAGQPKWIEEAMIEYSDLRVTAELHKMRDALTEAIRDSKQGRKDIMLIKQMLLN